jgi:hypothetical protein
MRPRQQDNEVAACEQINQSDQHCDPAKAQQKHSKSTAEARYRTTNNNGLVDANAMPTGPITQHHALARPLLPL